jgi:hypothetical protein
MRTLAFALLGAIFGIYALPVVVGMIIQAVSGLPMGENLGLGLLMIPGGVFGLILGLWLSTRGQRARRAR